MENGPRLVPRLVATGFADGAGAAAQFNPLSPGTPTYAERPYAADPNSATPNAYHPMTSIMGYMEDDGQQKSYGAPSYVTPTAPRTANTNSAVSMAHPMIGNYFMMI
jgi:hypothetical protein